jgi:signal transduction histidine kinase
VEKLTSGVRGEAIALLRRVEPEGLEVTADPGLIEQVLINLINNAAWMLKETDDARVELLGKLNERGRVVIQVIDNGPGIEPSVLDRIFIPFFSTKPEGSGIGLSLSRQIMRMHQGDLSASSTPGERTVFVLRF